MTSLQTVLGCDLRTLAFFRLGLGCALLVDLVSRARDLRAHYTYFGVVPSPTGPESFFLAFIHLFIGSAWFQVAVFLGTGLAALALMVGYHTRLFTVVCWCLLIFIQTRTSLTIDGGDALLLLLFFWSIFLPLGARYSFDAAMDQTPPEESPNPYFSMGTLAILLQVACLYFFSAFLKNSPEWIPDGTAIYYALYLPAYVHPLGEWLREFSLLMKGLTYYTWVLELIGPVLIFSPWFFLPLRLSMLIMFVLLHLGIVVCLNVGLFPLINIVSLVLFIPSWCWDRLTPCLQTPARGGLTIFYDGECEFCRKMCLLFKTFLILPDAPILPAQEHPQILAIMERNQAWVVQDHHGHQHTKWEGVLFLVCQSPLFGPLTHVLRLPPLHAIGTRVYHSIATHRGELSRLTRVALPFHQLELHPSPVIELIVGLLAIYMVFINLLTVPNLPFSLADPVEIVQSTLKLRQRWNMFAPHPRKYDGWYVIPGRLIDGTEVDVYNLRMQAPRLENSSFEESPYLNYRWRKYLQRLVRKKYQEKRKYYGAYLCRAWNESQHPLQQLLSFQVYFVKVNTPSPDHDQPPKREMLKIWEQSCLKSQE